MKQVMRYLLLIAVAVAFSGCGKKDKKSGLSKRRGGDRDRISATGNGTVSSAEWPGYIDGTSQQDLDDLISASDDPEETVGYIDSNGTGLRLRGDVRGTSNYRPNSSNNMDIRDGHIEILVWDSVAVDSGYGLVLRFEVDAGDASGDSITIETSDDYGQVWLDGRNVGNRFIGDIRFRNDAHWDGQSPEDGVLGEFDIPTCDILRCN